MSFIGLMPVISRAQDTKISKKTTFNGLPNNVVYATFKDSRGLIWCGTGTGLAIYQGNRFIPVNSNTMDTNNILRGIVYAIQEDKHHMIWAGNYTNGITVFNPCSNIYKKLRPSEFPELEAKNIITLENIMNRIFINTSKGSYEWQSDIGRMNENLPPEFQNEQVLMSRIIEGKKYFLLQNNGLLEHDLNNNWNIYKTTNGESNFMGLTIIDTQVFVSGFGGIYLKKKEALIKCQTMFNGNDIGKFGINDLVEGDRGQIYVNSLKYGLLKAKFSSGTFYCSRMTTTQLYDEGNNLYSNFYDKENNKFYVGTQQGLFILDQKTQLFKETTYREASMGTVRSLYSLKNELLIGTEDGIFARSANGTVLHLTSKKESRYFITSCTGLTPQITLFGGNTAYQVKNNTVNSFDPVSSQLLVDENNVFVNRLNDSIICYVASAGRKIIQYNQNSGNIQSYPIQIEAGLIPPSLCFNGHKMLFISYTGLYEFDFKTRTEKKITLKENPEVSDMEYKNGLIYFSTSNNGICIMDTSYVLQHKIDISKISGSNDVRSIQVQNSIIWFSTPKGIGYYNNSTKQQAFFASGESFSISNFYAASKAVIGDTLFFGGDGGIVSFNMKTLLSTPIETDAYLINASVYRNGGLIKIVETELHTFSHEENNLEVLLVHTNVDYPSYFKYEYRLNESNPWVRLEESRILKLYNLPPDNYHVQVKELNEDKIVATWNFSILPPWYQSWWFRILLSILIIANVIWITRLYFKRRIIAQQKEIEKQIALQSERDRISIDMHDDLGSGLSSIKLISEMLKKKHKDNETQNDLNQIVENAKELTSTMRDMVWSLNPRNDTLERFIDHVRNHTYSFFERSDIQCKMNMPSSVPNIILSGFVRRNLFLCVKETLNNIVKHSNATSVELSIENKDPKLHIIISDNGIGLPIELKENNGFYNMRKRVKDCNGEIKWASRNPGLVTTIEMDLS